MSLDFLNYSENDELRKRLGEAQKRERESQEEITEASRDARLTELVAKGITDECAALRSENERLLAGIRSQAIAGTKHWFYAPCSNCGAIEGMGLSSRGKGTVAVWCCYCAHFGPTIQGLSQEKDRAAVMAWNEEFRVAFERLAGMHAPDCEVDAALAGESKPIERMGRILRDMSIEQRESFIAIFNNLSPEEAQAAVLARRERKAQSETGGAA